jgi:hypothetical protein
LVPGQGGVDFQTAGAPQEVLLERNLLVVEDLKEGANAEMGPKDLFEIGSNNSDPLHLSKKKWPPFLSSRQSARGRGIGRSGDPPPLHRSALIKK